MNYISLLAATGHLRTGPFEIQIIEPDFNKVTI
jgi:hypothetical protein